MSWIKQSDPCIESNMGRPVGRCLVSLFTLLITTSPNSSHISNASNGLWTTRLPVIKPPCAHYSKLGINSESITNSSLRVGWQSFPLVCYQACLRPSLYGSCPYTPPYQRLKSEDHGLLPVCTTCAVSVLVCESRIIPTHRRHLEPACAIEPIIAPVTAWFFYSEHRD